MNWTDEEFAAHQQWLAQLQPGDLVITGRGEQMRVRKVERLTRTQIVLHDTADRYKRTTGRLLGSGPFRYLQKPTDQLRASIAAAQARMRFRSLVHRTDTITDAQITAMLQAYDATKAP